MAIVLDLKTAMAANLASTTLALSGDPGKFFRKVEEFLAELPCQAEKRKENALKAQLYHPDGHWAVVKVRCHRFTESTIGDVLEWRRHSGDCVFFDLVYRMFQEYVNKGIQPSLFVGQLCPHAPGLKPSLAPYPNGMELAPYYLEGRGEKRKRNTDAPLEMRLCTRS